MSMPRTVSFTDLLCRTDAGDKESSTAIIFLVHHAGDLHYLRDSVLELAKRLIARLRTVCPPNDDWPAPQKLDWTAISAFLMGIHFLSDHKWVTASRLCDADVCKTLARLLVYVTFSCTIPLRLTVCILGNISKWGDAVENGSTITLSPHSPDSLSLTKRAERWSMMPYAARVPSVSCAVSHRPGLDGDMSGWGARPGA
jgi:hypothetical protein